MNIKSVTLALAVLLLAINVGCRVSDSSASSPIQPSAQATEQQALAIADCGDVAINQQVGNQTLRRNPIRIAVFQDKSGSANTTRTAQLSEADFAAPIRLLRCTSGELAVGIVDDVSNRSLVRLRIEAPPAAPPPPQVSNAFQRAEQDANYQQRLKNYEVAVAKWTADTDRTVQAFLVKVAELLKQKSNAKKTNVWSAISRADLFLNESDATWPQPTHRWLVLNSDGVDTANSKPVEMKSSARLVVVNGIGSAGAAASLKPDLFEAVQPAFDFIAAKELGGK